MHMWLLVGQVRRSAGTPPYLFVSVCVCELCLGICTCVYVSMYMYMNIYEYIPKSSRVKVRFLLLKVSIELTLQPRIAGRRQGAQARVPKPKYLAQLPRACDPGLLVVVRVPKPGYLSLSTSPSCQSQGT